MKFILASASQRRQQFFKFLIPEFKVITSDINEEELAKLARTPQEMVMGLARAKTKKVWDSLGRDRSDLIVLGADTTVIISKNQSWKSLGKPKDELEAKQMLQFLRGNKHQVYTGICMYIGSECRSSTPKIITDFDISTVSFGRFSDEEIDAYIATGTVMDKAGAYAIQDVGTAFHITVEGSYSNVVGLPMERLVKYFDELGIKYTNNWRDNLQFANPNFQ